MLLLAGLVLSSSAQVASTTSRAPAAGKASAPKADATQAARATTDQEASSSESDESESSDSNAGETADAGRKFIRLARDDQGEVVALETSIVRYEPKEGSDQQGLVVDLVAVVHIGEQAYYEKLNETFKQYDALLYELVAPEGTRVEKGAQRSDNPVSGLQMGMKNMLDLDYQLEFIDYQAANFVHADLSPEEFSERMEARGESVWTMVFRMMGQGMAQQSENPNRSFDAELLLAFFDSNRAIALKRVLAQQFEDLDGQMSAFGEDGSAIISDRNKKALEVLAREIKAGKKKLAIFYGAGHMVEMEETLLADFGLRPTGEDWLTAWDMGKASDASAPTTRESKDAESSR